MRIRILGPLQVVTDGKATEIGGARLRVLLLRLALEPGRTVGTGALARAVWPQDEPGDRAHALQELVSRLRRALPDRAVVRSTAGGYLLDLPSTAVDASEFEELVLEASRLRKSAEPAAAARRLRDGLALWRGDALADAAQAPFAIAATARLGELRLAAVEELLSIDLEHRLDGAAPVAELAELVAAHPIRERLRLLYIRALHAEGRNAEALRAYEEFRLLLAEELGADPGPALRAVHLELLREGEGHSHSEIRRGNLRLALTSFVGRSAERAELGTQVRARRLVSLTGPGGVGKTRLATTLAAEFAETLTGGAWFVELGSVTDPAMVPRTVIDTIQLREAPPQLAARDDLAHLVEGLTTAETLIVLDNCEHLLDPVARLVDEVLSRCPSVRILVTTREPLGIGGEQMIPIEPLPLPEHATDDAAVLFADRAAAVHPGFAIDEQNLAIVIDICRRLDGLPLAIELAAARTRSLPLEELATRLDDRFRVLISGSRTATPRHLGLRAVIAWSWELLEHDLQNFLARLGVFAAPFTVEAAAYVGSPAGDVLESLSALVEKSLLQLVDGPRPRYRMLETIRAFAAERLAATGVTAEVRAAHATYCRDLAESAEPQLRTPDQLRWIRLLAAERENLLTALDYAAAAGDSETALRLAGALSTYWCIGGHHHEAVTRIRRAFQIPGAVPGDIRAVAVGGALLNAVLSGAKPDSVESSGTWPVPDVLDGPPLAVLATPLHALISDDIPGGLMAVDARLPRGQVWERAMLWLTRAMLDGNNGNMAAIDHDLRQSVAEFRSAGERSGLAFALLALADTRTTLGDFAEAIVLLEESIALRSELDAAYGESGTAVVQRVWLATARARTGDPDRARDELTALIAEAAGAPGNPHLPLARITLGDLARHSGDLPAATRHYRAAAHELDQAPSFPQLRVLLGAGNALAALAANDIDGAQGHLTAVLHTLDDGVPDMPIMATFGTAAAQLLLRRSEPATAALLLGAAETLRGAPDAFDPDITSLTAELREVLGERVCRAAYDRGRGHDRADALTVITSELERSAPDRDRLPARPDGDSHGPATTFAGRGRPSEP